MAKTRGFEAHPSGRVNPKLSEIRSRIGARYGGAGGGIVGSNPFVIGATALNTAVIRAALDDLQSDVDDVLWLSAGDSVTASGCSDAFPLGFRAHARPNFEAIQFATALGVLCEDRTVWNVAGKTTTAAYETMNPEWNFVSGTIGSGTSIGGRNFQHSALSGADVYTPGGTFDRIRLRYTGPTTGRTILMVASTGASVSLAGDSVFTPKTHILDCAGNATTVSLRAATTAAAVNWMSVECYNVGTKRMSVQNGGWNGSDSIDWSATASATNAPGMLTHIAADMLMFQIGTNDANDLTPIATFKTNYQVVIDAQIAGGGNMAVLGMPPLNPALYTNQANIDAYDTALREIAVDNSLPFLDLNGFLGGYTNSVAQGWTYSDGTHLTEAGATKAAELTTAFVTQIMDF